MAGSVPRIVMKFGGTSVGDLNRIKNVAQRVKKQKEAGCAVLVVVSAMAGETDRLVSYCQEISPLYDPAEYDSIVATGEQVTSGLVALALQTMGVSSRSFAGWQVPIQTDLLHSKANLDTIDGARLLASMEKGIVPVVAGFQGVTSDKRVSTLGRGGSDTSAVALAAAIQADRCDIYTDVDGIYTSDPRIVSKARKLDKITYEEMLELASVGAKVLQTRSVGLAMRAGVRLQVLSSFIEGPAVMEGQLPGSLVVGEEEIVEKKLVTGVTCSRDEAKLSLRRIPDKPGIAAAIFGPLSAANVNVDMIVQSTGTDDRTNMVFTTSKTDLPRAIRVLEDVRDNVQYQELAVEPDIVKVSIVGTGMRSHTGVADTMFRTLSERAINIEAISTSEIKISVLVAADYAELAVRALHTAYGLDEV